MIFPATSSTKLVLCGAAMACAVILIYGQVASGVTLPIVRFRTSQPRAFWILVGIYAVILVSPIAVLVLWRR